MRSESSCPWYLAKRRVINRIMRQLIDQWTHSTNEQSYQRVSQSTMRTPAEPRPSLSRGNHEEVKSLAFIWSCAGFHHWTPSLLIFVYCLDIYIAVGIRSFVFVFFRWRNAHLRSSVRNLSPFFLNCLYSASTKAILTVTLSTFLRIFLIAFALAQVICSLAEHVSESLVPHHKCMLRIVATRITRIRPRRLHDLLGIV